MTQAPPPPPQDSHSPVPPQDFAAPQAVAAGLATAGLVLGICAFIPCLGILTGVTGAILAIIALARGTTTKGRAITGLALAIAGFVIGQGLALGLAIGGSSFIPSLSRARELAKRAACASHLQGIGQGSALYMAENQDVFPPTLQHLIDSGQPSNLFICPSDDEDEEPFDYFYLPATSASSGDTMIACDFRDNHDDYRNILFADCSTGDLTEREFQDALGEPHNAAFAAGLR